MGRLWTKEVVVRCAFHFYLERKKYQGESAPIIECGEIALALIGPMAHHYATTVCGVGKDKRGLQHHINKPTIFGKIGKSGPKWMGGRYQRTHLELRGMYVQPIL